MPPGDKNEGEDKRKSIQVFSQQSDDGFVFKLQWNESPIIKNKRNKDMTKTNDIQEELSEFKSVSENLFKEESKKEVTFSLTQQIHDFEQESKRSRVITETPPGSKRQLLQKDQKTALKEENIDPYGVLLSSKNKQDIIVLSPDKPAVPIQSTDKVVQTKIDIKVGNTSQQVHIQHETIVQSHVNPPDASDTPDITLNACPMPTTSAVSSCSRSMSTPNSLFSKQFKDPNRYPQVKRSESTPISNHNTVISSTSKKTSTGQEDSDDFFTCEDLDILDKYEEIALSQHSIPKQIMSNSVSLNDKSNHSFQTCASSSMPPLPVFNLPPSKTEISQPSITNIASIHPFHTKSATSSFLNDSSLIKNSAPVNFTPIKGNLKPIQVQQNPLSTTKSLPLNHPLNVSDSFTNIDLDELDRLEQNAIQSLESNQQSFQNPISDSQTQGSHLYGKIVEILNPSTTKSSTYAFQQPTNSIDFFIEENTSHKLYHIILKEDWTKVHLEVNALVNVIFDSIQVILPETIIISNSHNWLIIYPDELLTATYISSSYPCIRKTVISDLYYGNTFTTIDLLKGSMKHDLLEYSISLPLTSSLPLQLHHYILEHLVDYLDSIFYLNLSLSDIYVILHSILPSILQFKYFYSFSSAVVPILFQNYTHSLIFENSIKIEDNIWSPLWGIKGIIDIALKVTLTDPQKPPITFPLPLEIKTGRSTSVVHISHTAQLLLYTLLMNDRYGLMGRELSSFTDDMKNAFPAGLLLYITEAGTSSKTANSFSKTPSTPTGPSKASFESLITDEMIEDELQSFSQQKSIPPAAMIQGPSLKNYSTRSSYRDVDTNNHTIPKDVVQLWNQSMMTSSLPVSLKPFMSTVLSSLSQNHIDLQGILRKRRELRSLLIRRNEIVTWISARKETYKSVEQQYVSRTQNRSSCLSSDLHENPTYSNASTQLDIEDLYKSPVLPSLEVVHSCTWCDSLPICLLFYLSSLKNYCLSDMPPEISDLIKKNIPQIMNRKYIEYFKKWYSLLSIEQCATTSMVSPSFWNYTSAQRHEDKLGIGSLHLIDCQRCQSVISKSSPSTNPFYHVHSFTGYTVECTQHDSYIYCFEYNGPIVNIEPSEDSVYIVSTEVGDYALAYVMLLKVVPVPSNDSKTETSHASFSMNSTTDKGCTKYLLYAQSKREIILSDNRDVRDVLYRLDRTPGYDSTTMLISNVVHFLTQTQVNGECINNRGNRSQPLSQKSQLLSQHTQNTQSYSYPNVIALRSILIDDVLPTISSYPLTLEDYLEDCKRTIQQCSSMEPEKSKYYTTIYNSILPLLNKLNPSQLQCVLLCLRSKDLCLIQGMPGCGKTFLISLVIALLVMNNQRICIASHTHNSIDNVLLKIKDYGIHIVRLGDHHKVHPSITPYTLDSLLYSSSSSSNTLKQYDEIFHSMSVVACTVYTDIEFITHNIKIDVCIIDEAGQILEPAVLSTMMCCERTILVGDSKQLPPLVHSTLCSDYGLNVSLMRRLEIQAKRHHNSNYIGVLNTQYRMNKDIMRISNELIYKNKMIAGSEKIANDSLQLNRTSSFPPSFWLSTVLNPSQSVVFLNTDTIYGKNVLEEKQGDAGMESLFNSTEGTIVEIIVHAFLDHGLLCNSIGVISQYNAQINYISSHLSSYTSLHQKGIHKGFCERNHEDCLLEVSTVDKFQGRDKDCIIISLVRSNDSKRTGVLLKSWRRMNVAFTRAKKKLIVCGSVQLLSQVDIWKQFLDLVRAQYSYINLTLQDIQQH